MDVAWQALGPDTSFGEGTVLSSGELVVADWKEWRIVDPVAGTWRSTGGIHSQNSVGTTMAFSGVGALPYQ
jgi:hypothetical protein